MKRTLFRTTLAAALCGSLLACLPMTTAQAAEKPKSIEDMLKAAQLGAQKKQQEALANFEKAEKLFAAKKFDDAEKLYTQVKDSGVDLGYAKKRAIGKRLAAIQEQRLEAKEQAVRKQYADAVALYRKGEFEKAKAGFQSVRDSGISLGFFENRELKRYLSRVDNDIQTAKEKRKVAADQLAKADQQVKALNALKGEQLLGEDVEGKIKAAQDAIKSVEADQQWLGEALAAQLKDHRTQLDQIRGRRDAQETQTKEQIQAKLDEAAKLREAGKLDEANKKLQEVEQVTAPVVADLVKKARKRREDLQEQIAKRNRLEKERLQKKNALTKRLDEGKQLLADHKYEQAEKIFDEVGRADDVLEPAVIAAANKLAAQAASERERALADAKKRQRMVEECFDAGKEHLAAGRNAEAKAQFDKVAKLLAQDSKLKRPKKLDELLAKANDAVKAEQEKAKAVAAKRQQMESELAKADAALNAGNFDDAHKLLMALAHEMRESQIALSSEKQKQFQTLARKAEDARNAVEKARVKKLLAATQKQREVAQQRTTQQARAAKLIEEAMALEKVRQEQRKVEADHHYRVGKRLFDETRYKEAVAELHKCLNCCPDNDKAQKLLDRAQILVKGGGRGVSDFTAAVTIDQEVRISQARLNLTNTREQAQKLLADLKFDEAIEKLQFALSIITYLEKQVDVSADRHVVDSLLAKAKTLKAEAAKKLKAEKEIKAKEAINEYARRDEQRFREKKSQLFTQGWKAIREEQFDDAYKIAEQILEIDPEDQSAKILQDEAFQKRHIKTLRKLVKKKAEEEKRTTEKSLEQSVPYSELVTYPEKETWEHVIAARQPVKSSPGAGEDTEAQKKVKESLKKPVTLDFSDTPVGDVITFLQDFTGVNMILDPRAVDEEGSTITLKVDDMPLEKALEFILKFANLEYEIRGDAIYISNEEGLSAYDLRTYDVRDLLISIKDKEPTQMNISAGGGGGGGGLGGLGGGDTSSEEDELTLYDRATELIQLITQVIAADSWKYAFVSGGGEDEEEIELEEESEDAKGGIAYREGDIIVWQIPKVHADIAKMLASLRECKNMQVNIEARFVTLTDNFTETFGVQIDRFASRGKNKPTNGYIRDPEYGQPGHPDPYLRDPQYSSTNPVEGHYGLFLPNPHPAPSGTSFFSGPTTAYAFPNFYSPAQSQWFTGTTPWNQTSIAMPFIGTGISPDPANPEGLNLRFAFLGQRFIQGFLKAAQKSDQLDILTSPKLTLTNTQRGNILIGTVAPYVASYTASSNIAIPTIDYAFEDAVSFDVRPIISADRRYVFLELAPTMSDVLEWREFEFSSTTGTGTTTDVVTSTIQQPRTSIQTVAVTVSVPDRGTVLIGGLTSRSAKRHNQGVPILSKIPLIKRLFESDSQSHEKTNLIILVTPTIIIQEEDEAKL